MTLDAKRPRDEDMMDWDPSPNLRKCTKHDRDMAAIQGMRSLSHFCCCVDLESRENTQNPLASSETTTPPGNATQMD